MSEANIRQTSRLAVILGLTMALGPLTALSFGTRYAGEETWERARAGLQNAKPEDGLARYEKLDVPAYASGQTVVDVLEGAALFDSFKQALKASGMDQTLSGEGAYTVFVPSEESFAKLPAGERAALMSDKDAMARFAARHIVSGRYTATDLMQMRQAKNLNGEVIPVGPSAKVDGNIGYGDAAVIKSNIYAANGVVHVIDRPIL